MATVCSSPTLIFGCFGVGSAVPELGVGMGHGVPPHIEPWWDTGVLGWDVGTPGEGGRI